MEMVKETFGKETWDAVLKKCQLEEGGHFLQYQYYPDYETLSIIECVAQILNMPVNTLWHHHGGFFLRYVMDNGYDTLLNSLAVDFVTFIQNLDSMHALIARYSSCVSGKFPSLSCYEQDNGTVLVVYYTHRNYLVSMLIGVLEAVARVIFHQEATLAVVSQSKQEVGPEVILYQTVLKVELRELPIPRQALKWALGDVKQYQRSRKLSRWPVGDSQSISTGTESVLRAEDFSVALPFHLLMDRRMGLQQWGKGIANLSVVPIRKGTPFTDVATISEPVTYHTLDKIRQFINSVFIISIHRDPNELPLYLKGQMIWLSHSDHLLFTGTPLFKSLQDLQSHSFFLSDIPHYDVNRELLLLINQTTVHAELTKKGEDIREMLRKMSRMLRQEKQKTEGLLHEMLPKKIANQLKYGNAASGEIYKTCTVLFSDVLSFTEIACRCTAHEVVNMLNDMYFRFDIHTDVHNVYKVKTIGDAYMAVSGIPEVQSDHAQRMADFALDMMEEASNVMNPATAMPLLIRIGMHSGPVVAGVIGMKKPRYDVYGETVNIASCMEAYSLPDRIHVSKSTFNLLYADGYKFQCRGTITLKGKGDMDTYFLVGHLDRMILQPQDRYDSSPIICQSPSQSGRVKRKRKFKITVGRIPRVSIKQYSLKSRAGSSLRKRLPSFKRGLSFSNRRGSTMGGTALVKGKSRASHTKSLTRVRSNDDTVDTHFSESAAKQGSSSFLSKRSAQVKPVESKTGSTVMDDDDIVFSPYFGRHMEGEEPEFKTCTCTFRPFFGRHMDEDEEPKRKLKTCSCTVM